MAPIPTFKSSISSVRDAITDLPSSLTPRSSPPPPSRTIAARFLSIISRQSTPSIIPTTYGSSNNSLPAGTIVGIVLGSVAGFILLLWLVHTCMNPGGGAVSEYTESVIVAERRRNRRGSQRSRRVETVEVRRANRSRTPVRIVREEVRPVERVVVEEIRREESNADSDDEVVVIEEHSPPRRSKRDSRDSRRDSYRRDDPLAYGGSRSDRRSSRR